MPKVFRVAYFAHSLRSDWNNGNAHYLRGLLRAMLSLGHKVTVFEPEHGWSIDNLRMEALGERSLNDFELTYPEIDISTYSGSETEDCWRSALKDFEFVILHEWNSPSLSQQLLALREKLGFRLLFHDTHHRASSSPEQISLFGLRRFDGVLAFGDSLHRIYRDNFQIRNVWTLHEAADTTIFHPQPDRDLAESCNVVWIGNWGDNERSQEISDFFLKPASLLNHIAHFSIYGVRYPKDALTALANCNVQYGGYLPNLMAPETYTSSRVTVHIPRQQYTQAMTGIPTIRVFEALACGIPLVSAPWNDAEGLFRPGDIYFVRDTDEAVKALQELLLDPQRAEEQARRGLEVVLERHTCHHRAQQLSAICEEILS